MNHDEPRGGDSSVLCVRCAHAHPPPEHELSCEPSSMCSRVLPQVWVPGAGRLWCCAETVANLAQARLCVLCAV